MGKSIKLQYLPSVRHYQLTEYLIGGSNCILDHTFQENRRMEAAPNHLQCDGM